MAFLHDSHIWYALSFVVFVWLAWRYGRGPALATLDARIAAIAKEIAAAEDLHTEAQELLAQYKRKQRDAAKEVERIAETGRAHSARLRAQAQADLEALLAARRRRLDERLSLMRSAAEADIRAAAARVVADRAAEILAARAEGREGKTLIAISTEKARALVA
ncbi:MAG TPA: hypothetical protein DDX54_05460 [Rhodospirillaceae bacterium]|jgi:F-type H+-transporting ATPase subunit b|nr:hypothetical protein [Alphaproteobacteria bacterium]HBH26830.1 hypothetical protein [Rhodospirillaceae bacterium]